MNMENILNTSKTHTNILFVGPIGSGKSTLISAIANYMHFSKFEDALKHKEPIILAPLMSKVVDENGDRFLVTTGDLSYKDARKKGIPMTQEVKTYCFPIWDNTHWIRAIDTPGIGDFRGEAEDKEYMENILGHIGQMYHINAICFVFKSLDRAVPNEVMNSLLSLFYSLGSHICKNIIWCFTDTRKTFYSPGHSYGFIQEAIDMVEAHFPLISIPFKRNIFCFENEPFVHLLAHNNLVKLDDKVQRINEQSWHISKTQCYGLINYINGTSWTPDLPLIPMYPTERGLSSVNAARQLINMMMQPLGDMVLFLVSNIVLLIEHRKNILDAPIENGKTLCEVVPVLSFNVLNLEVPARVCINCYEFSKHQCINVFSLKHFCEFPCFINKNKNRIIGDKALLKCQAVDDVTEKCMICKCSNSKHLQIYYDVELKKRTISFVNKSKVMSNEKIIEETVRAAIDGRVSALKMEHDMLSLIAAEFSMFLKATSLTSHHDSFEEYIGGMINRDDQLNRNRKSFISLSLRRFLNMYKRQCTEIEMQSSSKNIQKTFDRFMYHLQKINYTIDLMWNLNIVGKDLLEMYAAQRLPRYREARSCEIYKQKSIRSTRWLQNDDIECLFTNYITTPSDTVKPKKYHEEWSTEPFPFYSNPEMYAPDSELLKLIQGNSDEHEKQICELDKYGLLNYSTEFYQFGPGFYPPPPNILKNLMTTSYSNVTKKRNA